MNYWNGGLIGGTRQAPSSLNSSGIFDLKSQMVYKASGEWPIPSVIVQTGINVWVDAGDTSSYSGSGSTWTDLSGNGNDGTLGGTYSLDSSDGGGSMHFNTGGADFDVYSTSLNASGGTLECWVKVVSTNSYRHICGWRGTDLFYLLLLSSNGKIEARVDGGSNTNGDIATTDLGASTWATNWTHIAYAVDTGNTAAYYRNGQLVGSQNHSGTFTDSSQVLELASAGSFGLGEMKHSIFRYYTQPLTAAEVLQNYEAEKLRHGHS